MASPHEQDAHTRHGGTSGGLRATALPARSGRRDRNGRSKPGVDLSHQTLATARTPKGFGGRLAGAQQLPVGVGLDD
ncbi:hypothetical protein CWR41_00020 [Cedecea lapagei]|nr:hypothetical protein CWR41_00020 [Cedecea lapagei]